jgi:hypothetical protein
MVLVMLRQLITTAMNADLLFHLSIPLFRAAPFLSLRARACGRCGQIDFHRCRDAPRDLQAKGDVKK